MNVIHYNPDTNDYIDSEGHSIQLYAACGALTGYITPLSLVEKLDVSENPNDVTCQNCRKTDIWKKHNLTNE